MRVRVLGCHGGETPRHRTTCLLIDERITIDAGAVCRSLALEDQVRIDHMLISHSHMDHVKDLALLADQVIGRRGEPVLLHCGPETAETLSSSYFNNYLWPDFTKIPTPQSPVMMIDVHEAESSFRIPPPGGGAVREIAAGRGKRGGRATTAAKGATSKKAKGTSAKGSPTKGTTSVQAAAPLASGEYDVQFIPVTHPVESMAMIIRGATGSILYSSDTGPTTRLWQIANQTNDLRGMFVELSFPNHMQALADVAGHYTPQTLEVELKKLRGRDEIPLFIYHLKPTFYEVTKNELAALRLKNAHLVELTDEFAF